MTEQEKASGPTSTHQDEDWQDSDEVTSASYETSSDEEQLTKDLVAGAASNLAVRGTLTFHFRDRDVSTETDGYSALRALTSIREGNSEWEDPLHPCFSDARNPWITIRTHRVLGASWIPGLVDEAAFSLDQQAA